MAKLRNQYEIRVRYRDTDKMGIVYNGNYFSYFEIGRNEMLRSMGMSYIEIEDRGYYLPLLSASAEFKQPAKYDDIITVITETDSNFGARFEFKYQIYRGEELLTTGSTQHCFVEIATMKSCRPPKFFLNFIEKYLSDFPLPDAGGATVG